MASLTKERKYGATAAACYAGLFSQALVTNFAPLLFITFKNEFGVGFDRLALLVTVSFITQLCMDASSVRLADLMGYRALAVTSLLFASAGLAGMTFLPPLFADPFSGLMLAAVIYGIGAGLIEVAVNPIMTAIPSPKSEAALNLLHSFYCWGHLATVLVSTAFFALFGTGSWRVLALIWATFPFAASLAFLKVPFAAIPGKNERLSLRGLLRSRGFFTLLLLMICAGASEMGIAQWSSAFAESALGVSKAVGDLAGPTMFAALMGLSRIIYAKFSARISLSDCMLAGSALCVVAYLLSSLSGNPVLGLAGCGLAGFSVGVMWPGTYAFAAKKNPNGGAAMFGLLALFGDIGCTSGPAVIGAAAGHFSDDLRVGLLAAAVYPAAMFVILLSRRLKRTQPS